MEKIRIVYYVNQFFGQEGGEEAASMGVSVHDGAYGIAKTFAEEYGESGQVVGTIICGDNYLAEKLDEAGAEIIELVKNYSPDAFVAGPAYAAGRYGVGCGYLCTQVSRRLRIPCVTAMNALNPGVEIYHKSAYIIKTGENARTAKKDVKHMADFLKKLVNGQELLSPDEEGYFSLGYKRNKKSDISPCTRAVNMLLDKFYGRPFTTEIPLPVAEDITKPAAIQDLSKITVALATDGGLYPADNPDKMPTANADHFCAYDISGQDSLKKGDWIIRHNGYDNTISNENPNRLVPVDAMRQIEQEGYVGKLYDKFLSTTGLVATVENATKTGKQMVQYVMDNHIDAVLLTST